MYRILDFVILHRFFHVLFFIVVHVLSVRSRRQYKTGLANLRQLFYWIDVYDFRFRNFVSFFLYIIFYSSPCLICVAPQLTQNGTSKLESSFLSDQCLGRSMEAVSGCVLNHIIFYFKPGSFEEYHEKRIKPSL